MSPLNRGSMMGARIPPPSMRPPLPRFGHVHPHVHPRVPPLPPGLTRVVPHPHPLGPMFGPRGRPIPGPPLDRRPSPMMNLVPSPPPPCMYGPLRGRLMHPMPIMPSMPIRGGPMGPHGPMMRPGPRGVLPPHALPHMRPRFPGYGKAKSSNAKKSNKIEELEMKKPWMTDEIRNEIQKKNKLYVKAKKNKDAKEWEEFKDLRNKVTRMIRDAKNEYFAKNPEQVVLKTAEKQTTENESVQKTQNTTEQTDLNEENKPSESEQAQS